MHILKPIQVVIKDLSKLPDTSRNDMISLVRTPHNPGGRLLPDKIYDVYGITETQARSWSFLLVSETNEMVWVDMQYCLFSQSPVPEVAVATLEEPQDEPPVEKKRGRKPAPVDPSLEAAPF